MMENKDPAIKLFGQKIPFPGDALASFITAGDASPAVMNTDREEEEENQQEEEDIEVFGELRDEEEETEKGDIKDPPADDEVTEKKKEADSHPNAAETNNNNKKDSDSIQNPKTPSKDEETAKSKKAKSENDENDSNNNNNSNSQQEKTLKKPDKILPCQRCNSMDTKFCYYNNYNVNQPRYFCKACQRYWTAGGTMRNVPVGAGRRKNKNSAASHYRHITISEALQAARIDSPNGTHIQNLKTNGRVLSFGLDPPICDSMASVLNLVENKKAISTGTRIGFHGIEDQRICKSVENNGDDCSSGSSITVSNSIDETGKTTAPTKEPIVQSNGFLAPQVSCIPSVPWPYPWNSAVPSPAAMCPPGIPISFYPAAFWNCSMPGNWNVPWFPSSNLSAHHTKSPNLPALGKHPRDDESADKQDNLQNEEPLRQRNGRVLVPKTLRIDDPSEAAKSSIWATLGIKNECVSSGGGMFKAFKSKKEEKNHNLVVETSSVLRANPAALSRSLNFHENS